MTLSLTLDWIIEKLELKEENLDNIKSLSLPGRYDEKISALGSSLVMFSRLKNLDLSRNALSSLSGLDSLAQLETLNLYYNCIDSMSELLKLRKNARLQQLDLRLNPVSRSEPDYRLYLIQMLPELKRLDDRNVAETERNSALLHFTTDQAAGLRALQDGRDGRQAPSIIDDDTEDAASEPAPSPRPPLPQPPRSQPAWQSPMSQTLQSRDSAYSEWLSEVKAQGRWAAAADSPPPPLPPPSPAPQRHQAGRPQQAATAARRFHSESYGSTKQSASGRAAGQQLQRPQLGDPPSSESSQPNSDNEGTKDAESSAAAAAAKAAETAASGERRSSFSSSLNAGSGVPRLVLSDSGRSAGGQLGADRQRVLKKKLPRARWEKTPPPQQQPPLPAGRIRKEAAADATAKEVGDMTAQQQQGQQQAQLQCGECPGLDLTKPCPFLNELAALAEKHWAGPGSLLRSRRFQEAGRSVLMQLAQFVRSESASASAAEAATLNSRLAYLEQENARLLREVGQLNGGGSSGGGSGSRSLRNQFDSAGYQPASQSQVDELTREIDRLKGKLRSLEQVELISAMLQESHKSLLLTNEHLMSELRLMRRREDGPTGASAGSSVAEFAKSSLPGGYGRKARDQPSDYEDSATPHSTASSHPLNGGGGGGRTFGNGRQTSAGGAGGLETVGKMADWR